MRTRGVAEAILLAASLLPGCSNPLATERDAFEENLQKWNAAAIDAYEFDYRLNCFCGGPGVRPVHIDVRAGAVIAVSFSDGGPPEPYDLAEYPTIPDLFADVEASLARKPFSVRVEYDGTRATRGTSSRTSWRTRSMRSSALSPPT